MVLRHALLARAVALSKQDFEIKSVVDIITEDTAAVPSFPWKSTVNLVFWAKGTPNETFKWMYGWDGPDGSAFRSPEVPGESKPSGETHGTAQVPLEAARSGRFSVWIKFGKSEVWRRS